MNFHNFISPSTDSEFLKKETLLNTCIPPHQNETPVGIPCNSFIKRVSNNSTNGVEIQLFNIPHHNMQYACVHIKYNIPLNAAKCRHGYYKLQLHPTQPLRIRRWNIRRIFMACSVKSWRLIVVEMIRWFVLISKNY